MSAPIPKITRLSDKIIRILGLNPGIMTLQGTNTYLIGSKRKRVLIDCGEDKAEYIKMLQDVIKTNKLFLSDVIITHWHHDHIGGLGQLIDNFKGTTIHKWRSPKYDPTTFQIKNVEDEQEIKLEDCTLKIYYTPGHTEDHIIVVLKEENALFSGDCILGEGTTVFEELWSYMKSLERIKKLKPAIIYPGHGPEILDPLNKIKEYISHRNLREKSILEILPKNHSKAISVEKIVEIVYKDTPRELHIAAASNVKHHLNKLKKDGKIGEATYNEECIFWLKE